jgi:hypothetical protein
MYKARNENQTKQKKNIILHFKTLVIMTTFWFKNEMELLSDIAMSHLRDMKVKRAIHS